MVKKFKSLAQLREESMHRERDSWILEREKLMVQLDSLNRKVVLLEKIQPGQWEGR